MKKIKSIIFKLCLWILTKLDSKVEQTKSGDRKNMIYAFTGISGHKYYYFEDTLNDLNAGRYFLYYQLLLKEFSQGITYEALQNFIEAHKKYNTIKEKDYAVICLENRKNISCDTDLMFQMMAVLYLREDEPNDVCDQKLIIEKSQDIKQTMSSLGGAGGFFQCPEFRKFLDSANLSEINWNAYMKLTEETHQVFRQMLDKIPQLTR